MQIILFREKSGRARPYRIPDALLFAIVLVVLAGLAGNVLVASRYVGNDLLDSQIIGRWQTALDAQAHELERIRGEARVEMEAVGRRLATMQARLVRMEALGQRVVEVARLDEREFRFDESPALGGPEADLDEPQAVPEYLQALGTLSTQMRSREDQLELLATLLSNRSVGAQFALAGRPVTIGSMTSGFGRRVDPISGHMAWHPGTDFAGSAGSPVVAVASGVVTFAGERSGYGQVIEIDHGGGYVTRYGHHQELLVGVGDVVKKGQTIGRMGSTGRSTGSHVHFEILKDGQQIDPARFIALARSA